MAFESLQTLGTSPNAWLVDKDNADITRAPLPPRAIALPTATKTLKLDLSKAALLVVDMQNDFCHPDGWLAHIGVDVTPLQSAIAPLQTLLPALRTVNIPILWLNWGNRPDLLNISAGQRHVYNPTGKGIGLGDPLPARGDAVLTSGSWAAAVIDEFVQLPQDIRVNKYRMSGFWDTPLDSILRNLGRTTLFFAGVNADQSKLGLMPIVLHRPIPDGFDVKTVRIVRKHSGRYVTLCIQTDVSIPDVGPHGHSLGIDVGLEYFLSTSDGLQVERPRFFGKLQRKLKLLQRRLKRKQSRSNNRAKLIERIGRVHEQIAAARLDWQFKLAHRLCDNAQSIFVEDLDFRIMAKGFLGKDTLDAGLGQFANQVLPWVCFKRGIYYGKVDAYGTSQACPDCGAKVKKDLSVRLHKCGECGSTKPRDIAAAQVINARGQSGTENVCGWDLSGAGFAQSRQDRVM